MKILRYLVMLLGGTITGLVLASALVKVNAPRVTSEEQFAPIVSDWYRVMRRHGIESLHNVYISAVEEAPVALQGTVAWCDMSTHQVFVTMPNYRRAEALQHKMTIWHELGHCAFDLDHVLGVPHIMNPSIAMEEDYVKYHVVLEAEYLTTVKVRLAFPH